MANWVKIHWLEAQDKIWAKRQGNRRKELLKWRITGDRAQHWLAIHLQKHEKKAAAANEAQIAKIRPHIHKWRLLLTEAENKRHAIKVELQKLKPKQQAWHMGGWVSPGTPYRWQRCDQGQDFEIPLYHSVVAPGHGYCLGYASDGPFPSGFGNPYALVHFTDGPFAGSSWYLGHANEPIIKPGQHFVPGQPLARLNHSLSSGWGWIEIGHLPYGNMNEGYRWKHLFEKTVYR